MSYSEKIFGLSSRVNFTSLQQYLTTRGWKKSITKHDDIVVLSSPDDNPKFDLILPLSRNFTDYDQSIFESVKKISEYEKREEIQLLNDLIAPPADIVRYKIDNEFTKIGLIPLNSGFQLFESAKKSLLSAASDIIYPAPFHKRMAYRETIQFIDACYFGQTERSSFIASIVCPFIKVSKDDEPATLNLFSPVEVLKESFTRQVTKRLISSIVKVQDAIKNGREEDILNANGSDRISANFLESIVEINENTQKSKIDISITWAPTVPAPIDIPSSVEIVNDYIEPMKAIIDRIRPDIIEESGEYVGKISQLKADPDIKNREDAEISFVFVGEDEKATNARVILKNKEDIHSAIQAFDAGRNVKVIGKLVIQNRQRVIENPKFNIIE